jgi:hypothetical protein
VKSSRAKALNGLRMMPLFPRPSLKVGSRTGAVLRRSSLAGAPCFLWECLSIRTVNPFPIPASSHAACGFPALRVPVCFASRVM